MHVPATVRMRGWWPWWPEKRCLRLWGDHARPDAYGRWREDGLEVDFFLEHDTGTEPLTKVAAKLAGYATLAEATGVSTPVLFWLPSTARETNLRAAIAPPEVPVATAVHTPAIRTRGGEYTGELFKRACAAAGITQSMGRTASALNNAVAEAFNSTLEMELLSRSRFASRERSATQWPIASGDALRAPLTPETSAAPDRRAQRQAQSLPGQPRGAPQGIASSRVGEELGFEVVEGLADGAQRDVLFAEV
ncbi:replication-relaxation family protein [Streptomyces sp. 5-10]|uniref:replication-relaxation family protein n=1 Tax=Streptomyces sp. 5-10 TaxID=878925 RepID=UPI00295F0046|nr:replication-relaxation family protein [Streptomyces sp. 5-10]